MLFLGATGGSCEAGGEAASYMLVWFCFPEKELKVLRKENRKNAAIAMAIVLLIIVVYTCWTM